VTLEQLMQHPIETRRAWTQHDAGLNYDGEQVCLRCGISLPRLLPAFRPVCSHGQRLYLGPIPDATPCRKRSTQWNAQL
jgi:hypothetical protein